VVRQVEKLLNRTIPKMIHIELHLTESVFTVVADPGQLEQVLLNIGLNARDAMPEGGCLTIATANVIPDDIFRKIHLNNGSGPYVQIRMSDTGHGMSEEIIERIFDPFFTTKKIGQGTGLGLSMAYGIIKNHRGHIVCQSTPDVGTTFSIYLPAIDITVAPELATPEKPIEQGLNETVLVIDDEHYLRDLAFEILTPNGYTVLTAASGEEGLSVYRQNATHIAMVLLDLIMPGMGGKQCLSEILKINPQAKVLISSGYSIDSPNRDDILRWAAGFIQKPYHFRDMLQKIREVIVDDR
jgi:CheY-like chemotaxis protein